MDILSFFILLFSFYSSVSIFPGSIANSGREEKDESFELNITVNVNTDKYRVVTTRLNDVKVMFYVPNPGYIPVSIVQDDVKIWHANPDENCAYCMVYFLEDTPLMIYFLKETKYSIENVYYKYKNGGWEQSKKKFDSKIGKLKLGTQESTDVLTLDLRMPSFGTSKIIGCTLFGLSTSFIITSGGTTNTVAYGGVSLWTAKPGEKCIFVVHHSRNNEEPSIFDIFYTTSGGSLRHSYHVRKETGWSEVNMDGYYNEIKSLKGIQDNIDYATARGEPIPVRAPFTMDLDNVLISQVSINQARRNDVKCKDFEVRDKNSAVKVICQGQVLWEANTVYEKCVSAQVMSIGSHAIAKLKISSRFKKNKYFEMIAGTYTEIGEEEFKPLVAYMKKCSQRKTSFFTGEDEYDASGYTIDAAFYELENYEKPDDTDKADEETESRTDDDDDTSSTSTKLEEESVKDEESVGRSSDSLEKAEVPEKLEVEEPVVRPKVRQVSFKKSRGKVESLSEVAKAERFRKTISSYDSGEYTKTKEMRTKEGKVIVPLGELQKDFSGMLARICQSLEFAQSTIKTAQGTLGSYAQAYRETKESLSQEKVDEARRTLEVMYSSLRGEGAASATSSALEKALESLPERVEFKENVVATHESALVDVLEAIKDAIRKLRAIPDLPRLDDESGSDSSKEPEEYTRE